MTRIATCSCGSLRVVCAGETQRVALCHCLACQKRTGSTYGIAEPSFASRTFTRERPLSLYTRQADSAFGSLPLLPVRFWQARQWQSATLWGSPAQTTRRLPQEHVAIRVMEISLRESRAICTSALVARSEHWMRALRGTGQPSITNIVPVMFLCSSGVSLVFG